MLALLPTALLLLAALGVLILQRLRPSVGYAWMISTIASLLSMGWVIYLRWHLPQLAVLKDWLPFTQFTDSPIFGLDGASWPYMFGLAVVCLAVILTASVRLEYNVSPYAWVGVLSLVGVGMLAVLSANLLTLILAWTLIDLIELVILQANSSVRTLGIQTVISFGIRVTGTVLAMVAALISRSQNLAPTFAELPPVNALLLLLAVGLRLGVLPLSLPSAQTLIMRRGLGTTLRMAPAASALVVLARLPADGISQPVGSLLLAFCALATLYAAVVWASASSEISGRPYWLIALSGLAVASVIEGRPSASLAWGLALILPGSLLFLFSARRRQVLYLPALGLLTFSGLPFTPAASGWLGVFNPPFQIWQVLLLIAHAVVMLGYVRFMLAPGDDLARMERWIQAAYPLGLGMIVLGAIFTGLVGWPGSFSPGMWWAGPASAALAALAGTGVIIWRQRASQETALTRWYTNALHVTAAFLAGLLNLGWLYRGMWWVYRRMAQAIQLITDILEGDGGVLWAMVLLALLFSLLQSRLTR